MIFTPTPDQLGSYTFTLVASDGALETTQEVTLNVVSDPVTTTRVSGVILNTEEEPLAGVVVEIGNVQAVTGTDGTFLLEVDGEFSSDTLIIHGEGIEGDEVYPFIAEKLPLMYGHETYVGVNNVIDRPIYLPALDVDNGQTIDPTQDTVVTTPNIEGAAVTVAAGSLMDQSGDPFTGVLSITEVPTDLTPAALPEGLSPDLVVTIQPGEMVFETPAPLTLPNTAGYAPGALMDLWSINPETGEFEVVGTGQVSEDGSVIETIEGGINNSSWHFFAPFLQALADLLKNPLNLFSGCKDCPDKADLNSEVESHSGAVIETHNLVSYESLGENRGITLTYDSLRADPRPIVHFGYEDVNPDSIAFASDRLKLVAELTIHEGDFDYQVPGYEGDKYGLDGGEHIWSIPETPGDVDAALQADLRDFESGVYDYTIESGIYVFQDKLFRGTSSTNEGELIHVNTIDSSFGSGWGLAGLQEIVEAPDESVLLIDGDGSELLFESSPIDEGVYISPPGDFSTLEKLDDGTFQRTMTDQTVYDFNANNQLVSMVDRNGNQTQYVYDAEQRLTEIIDPVGLVTTFTYNANSLVSEITDPAGRVTQLEYDELGNLTRITDPDGTNRTWEYDANHHMTAEVDQRGHREEATYDFAGRATEGIRKDGSTVQVAPAQVQGLYRPEETIDPLNAPMTFDLEDPVATTVDGNGNVIQTQLDQAGTKRHGY